MNQTTIATHVTALFELQVHVVDIDFRGLATVYFQGSHRKDTFTVPYEDLDVVPRAEFEAMQADSQTKRAA